MLDDVVRDARTAGDIVVLLVINGGNCMGGSCVGSGIVILNRKGRKR